jgi:EAL domain-containing protein (putative c-di-GMP-specific phosphodiesterase class I)
MLSDSLTGFCNRIGFEEQLLRRVRCSVGQGYYYARPLPEDAAYAFLAADMAASTS